jgi:hypothetical protein
MALCATIGFTTTIRIAANSQSAGGARSVRDGSTSPLIDPTAGNYSYHQIRTGSSLSGFMFGVDSQGYITPGGPVAYSTPVANTIGHGRFYLAGDQYSFDYEKPVFDGAHGNWNFSLIYGATFGRFNVSFTANVVDEFLETLGEIEVQYIPSRKDRLTFGVGVEDIFNTSPTVRPGDIPDDQGRGTAPDDSFFGVATYNFGTRYNVNLSSGVGNHRFRAWFDSVSVQVAHPVRVWAENDGYGINAGILYWNKIGRGRHGHPISVLLGNARLKYFLFGAGIGL